VFLIIEGLHDSGKSTLANDISHNICSRFKLYEGKRLFPEFNDATITNVSDFALGSNCAIVWFAQYLANYNSYTQHIIFDRFHLSEYAYSIVKRNIDKDKAMKTFKMIDDKLSKLDVKLIYLHCDYDSMIERVKQKNKVYDKKDFFKLTETFDEACNISKIKMIKVDTGKHDQKKMVSLVRDFITRGTVL